MNLWISVLEEAESLVLAWPIDLQAAIDHGVTLICEVELLDKIE